jgi:hypothetical protein
MVIKSERHVEKMRIGGIGFTLSDGSHVGDFMGNLVNARLEQILKNTNDLGNFPKMTVSLEGKPFEIPAGQVLCVHYYSDDGSRPGKTLKWGDYLREGKPEQITRDKVVTYTIP